MKLDIRQEVWLASYLTDARLDTFRQALESLSAQTLKPDIVYVSVCGPNIAQAEEMVVESLTSVPYKLLLYPERYSQFDQLYMIYKACSTPRPKLTYITVLDDDDYFHPNRIARQLYLIEQHNASTSFIVGFDFGGLCLLLSEYDAFFATKYDETNIPPDLWLMTVAKCHLTKECLHSRGSRLKRDWLDSREDGAKWWTTTLLPPAQAGNDTVP